jgi:hypothetical protein
MGVAIGGAASFGKDDEGQAVFEGGDAAVEAGYGVAGAGLVDWNLAGAVEVPADEGSLPEGLLGEDAELEGKFGEEDGRVVVAEVVGGVDGDVVLMELLFIDELDGGEADEKKASGPDVGDEVLLAAGFVPKAAYEGDAAEEDGGKGNEGEKEEVGEPTEEGWGLRLLRRGLWSVVRRTVFL